MTVFLEHGYAGATVELVVQRAQASKATIYSFFGGKEGLFDALMMNGPNASSRVSRTSTVRL